MSTHIPVVDFADLINEKNDVENEVLQELAGQLISAFKTVGICYIKIHGVDHMLIQQYFDVSRDFFMMSPDIKQRWTRNNFADNFGWVAEGTEVVNRTRPASLRESFNFFMRGDHAGPEVKAFLDTSQQMMVQCGKFAHQILQLLSIGLGLDRNVFGDSHEHMLLKGNMSCLKPSYYLPILDDSNIKPGQIRLGEHSDFGSLTVLFQDAIGGLEAEVPDVGFVPVPPIPGTAVVNIGDMIQRWTSDKLVATKHRVVIPEEELEKKCPRQSVAFFVHPDDDVMISCLDGSNKYEPITSPEYLKQKLSELHKRVD